MNGDTIMRAMNELCVSYAKSQVAHAMAEHAADPDERARHVQAVKYWDAAVSRQHRALAEMLDDAFTAEAEVESFLPVQPLPTGDVVVRARDERTRPVVVRLTCQQALAVGAHLTAYAAIGLDRSSGKVAEVLPKVDAAPPFISPRFVAAQITASPDAAPAVPSPTMQPGTTAATGPVAR
ncbi:hypothetical protein [Dactylosporangium sp. NPDC006015]|uniref:hypothetical protein n=1 Tax=Dactylosporangium sp. NPDC006015 TaxID=3154576 RepID=UPI0033BC7929